MDLSTAASAAALVIAVPAFVALSLRAGREPQWRAPLFLAAGFGAWTVYAIVADGPFGFIPEHVGNAWETQIWMDILILGGVGWFLLQPRLKAVGIRPLLWLPLVLATGSIGMLVLLARLLRAEHSNPTSLSQQRAGSPATP